MVQLDPDKQLPLLENIDIDGNYDPRVMILDKFGRVATSLKNEARKKDKLYLYPNAEELVNTMEALVSKQRTGKKRRFTDELWIKPLVW